MTDRILLNPQSLTAYTSIPFKMSLNFEVINSNDIESAISHIVWERRNAQCDEEVYDITPLKFHVTNVPFYLLDDEAYWLDKEHTRAYVCSGSSWRIVFKNLEEWEVQDIQLLQGLLHIDNCVTTINMRYNSYDDWDSDLDDECDDHQDIYNICMFKDVCNKAWKRFHNFLYYQTYGGGPEGGYITNGVDWYSVHRAWGSPWRIRKLHTLKAHLCKDQICILYNRDEKVSEE